MGGYKILCGTRTRDEKTRADESAKFLRHLTYNHNEVVQAVMEDLPKQKRDQEPDFYG